MRKLTVKPGSVVDSHSSRPAIAHWLKQPTRVQYGPYLMNPYLALLRVEFTVPRTVTRRAVRSYRTLSPLPDPTCVGHRRFALCCTGRGLAPPRRYLAPCPMEPGLSSPPPVSPEEDDDEAYEDEDDDEDGDGLIEYECPHCGTVIFFDENAFDMEEEHLCPNCHRKVFEDDGEDGDDEE